MNVYVFKMPAFNNIVIKLFKTLLMLNLRNKNRATIPFMFTSRDKNRAKKTSFLHYFPEIFIARNGRKNLCRANFVAQHGSEQRITPHLTK